MSTGEELPDDATALAVLVQDPRTPRVKREAAMRKLHFMIERLARGLACSLTIPNQMRADLIADASADVWERLGSFNGRDGKKFVPWCRKVLRNRFIDRTRQAGREQIRTNVELEEQGANGAGTSEHGCNGAIACTVDAALDREELFGEQDLARIRGWKLRDRLVLLGLTNLWIKVPTGEWLEWVRTGGLEEPYPPCECATAEEQAERVGILAACCGMRPNTLCQVWHRKKALLAELDYIRCLRDEL